MVCLEDTCAHSSRQCVWLAWSACSDTVKVCFRVSGFLDMGEGAQFCLCSCWNFCLATPRRICVSVLGQRPLLSKRGRCKFSGRHSYAEDERQKSQTTGAMLQAQAQDTAAIWISSPADQEALKAGCACHTMQMCICCVPDSPSWLEQAMLCTCAFADQVSCTEGQSVATLTKERGTSNSSCAQTCAF